MKKQLRLALYVSSAVSTASVAHAQTQTNLPTPGPGAAARPGPKSGVEEVVVTARKRTERVQSVPATVIVLSKKQLAQDAVASFQDLSNIAPALQVSRSPSPGQFAVTIRGLGTQPGNPSLDSSVSLFVDGVYTPRSREFSDAIFDTADLEVIKGTQAALLGKNTSLGAVNLVTTKPGDTYGGDLIYQHGFQWGSDRVEGAVNLPFSQDFTVRIAGLYDNDNGPLTDTITGQHGLRTTNSAVRATAVWHMSDDVRVTATYQTSKDEFSGPIGEYFQATAAAFRLAALAGYPNSFSSAFNYKTAEYEPAYNTTNSANQTSHRGAVTVNWDLGDITFTSQTAYTGSRYNSDPGNVSFLPTNDFTQLVNDNSNQLTQELRLASATGGRFDWIAGLFYLNGHYINTTIQTTAYPPGTIPGLPIPIGGSADTYFDQFDQAYSAFGQANYKVWGPFKVTAGLRYTYEIKDVFENRLALTPGLYSLILDPPYPHLHLADGAGSIDGSIGLNYAVTPDVLLYTSFGQGTKAGGFAQAASNLINSEVQPEVAKTTELGFKSQFFNHALTANGALFYTTVDNYQLVTFNGINFVVGNTNLQSTGFESEVDYVPVRHLRLYWNNTFADSEDVKFGGKIPFAPRWSGTYGADYTWDVTDTKKVDLNFNLAYRSGEYSQQNPASSPALSQSRRLDASIGLQDTRQGWEVRLIGKNILDEHVFAFDFPGPLLPPGNQVGVPLNPFQLLLQLTLHR